MDFSPTNAAELKRIITKSGLKTSCQDPLPHGVLEKHVDTLLPVWVDIVNKSLSDGNFDGLKEAIISPLIKGYGLESEIKKNFCPGTPEQACGASCAF